MTKLILAVLVALALSACGSSTPAVDAGSDAGIADAGTDAGIVDAGP